MEASEGLFASRRMGGPPTAEDARAVAIIQLHWDSPQRLVVIGCGVLDDGLIRHGGSGIDVAGAPAHAGPGRRFEGAHERPGAGLDGLRELVESGREIPGRQARWNVMARTAWVNRVEDRNQNVAAWLVTHQADTRWVLRTMAGADAHEGVWRLHRTPAPKRNRPNERSLRFEAALDGWVIGNAKGPPVNSSVTLVLLLLLVSAAVALAFITNLRMHGWAEGFEGQTSQRRERVDGR
jgi:hypothetical protein